MKTYKQVNIENEFSFSASPFHSNVLFISKLLSEGWGNFLNKTYHKNGGLKSGQGSGTVSPNQFDSLTVSSKTVFPMKAKSLPSMEEHNSVFLKYHLRFTLLHKEPLKYDHLVEILTVQYQGNACMSSLKTVW